MVTALNVLQKACSQNDKEIENNQDQRLLDHGQGIWPSRQKPERCTFWFVCGVLFVWLFFFPSFFSFSESDKV